MSKNISFLNSDAILYRSDVFVKNRILFFFCDHRPYLRGNKLPKTKSLEPYALCPHEQAGSILLRLSSSISILLFGYSFNCYIPCTGEVSTIDACPDQTCAVSSENKSLGNRTNTVAMPNTTPGVTQPKRLILTLSGRKPGEKPPGTASAIIGSARQGDRLLRCHCHGIVSQKVHRRSGIPMRGRLTF